MSHDIGTLNEMIEVLDDARSFYEDAAANTARADLKQMFEHMTRTKTAIVNDLKNKVVTVGEKPSEHGSFAGTLRKGWGELRAKMASDTPGEYVVQLEEFEDRILHAFRDAVADSDDADVKQIAQKYMPEITRDHDAMRDLKHSVQATR